MATTKNVCSYAALTGKNAKGVDALIADAVKSAKTMREKTQVAAVAVLMHAAKCGDYTKADVLVKGMGQGVHAQALVQWFEVFGGLVIVDVKDADGKVVDKKFGQWKGKDFLETQFNKNNGPKQTAWWSFHNPKPYGGFDFMDYLRKGLAQADKAMQKINDAAEAGDDAEKERLLEVVSIDADMLKAVAALVKAA